MIIRRKPTPPVDAEPSEPAQGRPAPRAPDKRRGWDPFRLRREIEGVFRAAGGCVWREERGP